jgi:hypothetical protein
MHDVFQYIHAVIISCPGLSSQGSIIDHLCRGSSDLYCWSITYDV